jgi:hypothetical protein
MSYGKEDVAMDEDVMETEDIDEDGEEINLDTIDEANMPLRPVFPPLTAAQMSVSGLSIEMRIKTPIKDDEIDLFS